MTLSTDQQQRYIEIWTKAIDTQMHFNEMSVKSRQLGLTFVAAALGVAVVLVSRGKDFAISIPAEMPVLQVHISVVLRHKVHLIIKPGFAGLGEKPNNDDC